MTGTYREVIEIARGGMGRVSVALRSEGSFERLYAVKRLHEIYREDPELTAMFVDEARVAGLLRHPNVVSVLDVGQDEDGPYLVMDWIEGVSLSALLARLRGERLPIAIALEVARQAAIGLHAAHELGDHAGAPLGLVHRDVSPQNVLVGHDGIVRVTDFGIAKALGRSSRTATGVLKGKMGYMSPEQLKFLSVDRRTDLFSLGVVLYEMLSGERLYKDAPQRILYDPPPDLGEAREGASPELVSLAFDLLAKEPDQRPATALEVAERLHDILHGYVLMEGPVDLARFMEERFAEERTAVREKVSTRVDAIRGGEPDAGRALPPSRKSRVVAFVLVAIALVAAGGLIGSSLTEGEHDEGVAGGEHDEVLPGTGSAATPPEPGSAPSTAVPDTAARTPQSTALPATDEPSAARSDGESPTEREGAASTTGRVRESDEHAPARRARPTKRRRRSSAMTTEMAARPEGLPVWRQWP